MTNMKKTPGTNLPTKGKYPCEMCGERRICSMEDTVCYICDAEMVAAEKLAHKLHGKAARKCQDCGDELPPTRYFKCEVCRPELGGEDPYLEMCDDVDFDGMKEVREAPLPYLTGPLKAFNKQRAAK